MHIVIKDRNVNIRETNGKYWYPRKERDVVRYMDAHHERAQGPNELVWKMEEKVCQTHTSASKPHIKKTQASEESSSQKQHESQSTKPLSFSKSRERESL